MQKNCAYGKLILCKAMKKAMMEDKEQLLFPVAMGDEVIAITSSCIRGHLDIKKYGTQAQNTNWIANGTMPTLTIDILSASQWNICQNNTTKDNHCFLERCSLLCRILSIYTCIRPLLLAALHFGIANLQYPRHLSVGCMPLYGSGRYIDKDNLPCRLVKVSNCPKILLDRHTRTCYNQTFHVLKLI